jgi:hypothetical protein
VLVGAAAGARKPTSAEASAIRSAVAGFIATPGSPAAKDNRVASLNVSTVDPRYAEARLSSPSAGPSEMLLHRGVGGWWVVGFGSSPACDSAPRSVLEDLKVGCQPPYGVAWINDCGPLVSAPASLVLACADGNYELVRLTWHDWGHVTATARGTARANDCIPYCAAGHFHSYRVSVTAGSLRTCGSARFYARLVIAYVGARPRGIGTRDAYALGC